MKIKYTLRIILGMILANYNVSNCQNFYNSDFPVNFPGFTTRTRTTNYFSTDTLNNIWIVNPEIKGFNIIKLNSKLIPIFSISSKISLFSLSTIQYTQLDKEGNLIILGKLSTNNLFVSKFNATGDLLWSKYFHTGSSHDLSALSISPEGNIFILSLDNFGNPNQTSLYILLDPNGIIINQSNVNLSFGESYGLFGACHTEDNGFIAVGTGPNINNQNRSSTWILKVNSKGIIEWSKIITCPATYPNNYGIYGVTIDKLKGDRYLIMGRFGDDKNANNTNPIEMSGLLIEINSFGDFLKSNKIINSSKLFLNTVGAVEKDNQIFITSTQSYSEIANSLILFSLDSKNKIINSTFESIKLRHPDINLFENNLIVTGYNFDSKSLNFQTINKDLNTCKSSFTPLEIIPIELQQISHLTHVNKNILSFDFKIETEKSNCVHFKDSICIISTRDTFFRRIFLQGIGQAQIDGIDSIYCENSNEIDLRNAAIPVGGIFELNGSFVSKLDFSKIPLNQINKLVYRVLNNNCILTDSIFFKVIPSPSVYFDLDSSCIERKDTICLKGDNLSTISNLDWDVENGIILNGNESTKICIKWLKPGLNNVSLKFTHLNCGFLKLEKEINVDQVTVKTINDTSIMTGAYIDLLTNGNKLNLIYNWSPAHGLNCTDCINPRATPKFTSKYFVTAYDPITKCSAKDEVIIRVNCCK